MQAEHVIVGGLAGGLVALALARAGRGAGVILIEQGDRIGGNHTWSFHDTDLDGAGHDLVAELVGYRWPDQQVRFPAHERTLHTGYRTITSEAFSKVVTNHLAAAGGRLVLGAKVAEVSGTGARLEDGTFLRAPLVVDARGPQPVTEPGVKRDAGGYQKFVGLEVELEGDGPWALPLLMDATVAQRDGYRFMYVLPFSARRLLVEDTVYSTSPVLDMSLYERRIIEYLRAHGASVARVLRRESGVLPLPVVPPADGTSPAGPDKVSTMLVGYRGGFFHPVTGYSLPLGVRVALAVAAAATPADAQRAVERMHDSMQGQLRFGRLLNWLMFEMMPADARWTAFERFYRLPEETITRFYGSRSSLSDQARMLLGRPPKGVSWTRLIGVGRTQSESERQHGQEHQPGHEFNGIREHEPTARARGSVVPHGHREERQWKEVQ